MDADASSLTCAGLVLHPKTRLGRIFLQRFLQLNKGILQKDIPHNSKVMSNDKVAPQGQQESSAVVVQQLYPGQADVYQNNPPEDNLIGSICASICCLPIGLCAIYFDLWSKVLLEQGDVQKSHRMANNARNLMTVSVTLSIILIVILGLVQVILSYQTGIGWLFDQQQGE